MKTANVQDQKLNGRPKKKPKQKTTFNFMFSKPLQRIFEIRHLGFTAKTYKETLTHTYVLE